MGHVAFQTWNPPLACFSNSGSPFSAHFSGCCQLQPPLHEHLYLTFRPLMWKGSSLKAADADESFHRHKNSVGTQQTQCVKIMTRQRFWIKKSKNEQKYLPITTFFNCREAMDVFPIHPSPSARVFETVWPRRKQLFVCYLHIVFLL